MSRRNNASFAFVVFVLAVAAVLAVVIIVLTCGRAYGQIMSSSHAYSMQGDGTVIERLPGSVHRAHCTMCLGNHLAGWHGVPYGELKRVGWGNWQPMHDNSHNGGGSYATLKEPKTVPPIYAPTSLAVIEEAMLFMPLGEGRVFYDLGCGDGRVIIRAAELGANATGYEIDKELAGQAKANVRIAGVDAVVIGESFYGADLSDAGAVYMFLESELLKKLSPKLKGIPTGCVIVSYMHEIPGVKRQHVESVGDGELFVYKTPLR